MRSATVLAVPCLTIAADQIDGDEFEAGTRLAAKARVLSKGDAVFIAVQVSRIDEHQRIRLATQDIGHGTRHFGLDCPSSAQAHVSRSSVRRQCGPESCTARVALPRARVALPLRPSWIVDVQSDPLSSAARAVGPPSEARKLIPQRLLVLETALARRQRAVRCSSGGHKPDRQKARAFPKSHAPRRPTRHGWLAVARRGQRSQELRDRAREPLRQPSGRSNRLRAMANHPMRGML